MLNTHCQCYHHINSTLSSISMNALKKAHQKLWKDCKYSHEELQQILPFKNMFIDANTVPQQILILQNEILPVMFNYWALNGKEPKDEGESQLWAKVPILEHDLQNDKEYPYYLGIDDVVLE